MAEFTRDSIKQLIDSKFETFNAENELLSQDDNILLACSGNIDSIFALHYLHSKSYNLSVVVFDHLTRNGESTKDAEFVESVASKLGLPYYRKTLDIKNLIKESGNFQEVARIERYSFFESLIQKKGFTKLITAHHGDDNVETVLMNMGRASGLKGLRGIRPKSGKIIRPFLCLRKREISTYVQLNNITFRKDLSNDSSNYKRNYYRNEVIPIIENKDKLWVQQAMQSIENLRKWEDEIDLITEELYEIQDELLQIDLSKLILKKTPSLYLYHILSKYGFNMIQVREILLCKQVGKKWITDHFICFRERESIDVFDKNIIENEDCYHFHDDIPRLGKLPIKMLYNQNNSLIVPTDLDPNELEVRHKRSGDFIRTKQGKKKLKKFFADEKWSNYRKQKAFLIAKGNEVYWIEGY